MSLRAAQKQAGKIQKEAEEAEIDTANMLDTQPRKKKMMVFDDDSDEDYGQEEEEEVKVEVKKPVEEDQPEKKKKKKKNKKKKKQNDDEEEIEKVEEDQELAYLNQIVDQTRQEKEKIKELGFQAKVGDKGYAVSTEASILSMEKKFFSYKREMRQLFAESAQQHGALGLEDGDREERKGNNAINEQLEQQMEGASKRQKRQMKQMQKRYNQQKGNTTGIQGKFLFVQPNQNWPRPPAKFLGMRVSGTNENGQKIMSFQKSPEYQHLQIEFQQVQATMDIQNMMQFLQRNFYHHESLLNFADFLRLQGKFTDAFDFLERAIFAFEYAFSSEFQPIASEKVLDDLGGSEFFMPQVELDQGPGSEPLNTVFGDCLVKYIDVLGRKGCTKTALEYCKLLLGLNPKKDTHGVLLRIDYYAHRCRDHQFLLNFVNQFSTQIYAKHSSLKESKVSCMKLLPNLMMTQGLAMRALQTQEESKTHNEDLKRELSQINHHVEKGTIHLLFERQSSDLQVMLALLLYPKCLKQMLLKVAKKQLSQTFKKSWYEGYQAQNWKQILEHDIFEEEEQNYDWIVSDNERQAAGNKADGLFEETRDKIFNIFVERSGTLFSEDDTLMWLRETIAYTLNKIDSGDLIDRDLIIAQLQSGIVDIDFTWSRYRLSLKTADFMDDLSIVAPEDLMMGGQQPAGVPQFQDPEMGQQQNEAAQAQAEQQINQMINQLNRPMNPQQIQQQQQEFMIQQEEGNDMTQEEFEELQAVLAASMNQDNEEIVIGEEDDGEEANPGMIQQMMGMFGMGQQQMQAQDNDPEQQEDEKKDDQN